MSIETKTGIAEYSETEAAIANLRERFGPTVVWDVSTTKGLDAAKQARLEIKTIRTSLEKKRVELKAPILERGKLLDDEAKRITALLLEIEEPIDKIIKAEEERKQKEKEERERLERERIKGLRAQISAISSAPTTVIGKSSSILREKRAELLRLVVDVERFAELTDEAQHAHANAIESLDSMIAAAVAQEETAERLRQQQEENDRRQRELDEQQAAIRAQQEALKASAELRTESAPVIQQPAPAKQESQTPAPVASSASTGFKPKQVARPTDAELTSVIAFHFNVSEEVAAEWLASFAHQSKEVA